MTSNTKEAIDYQIDNSNVDTNFIRVTILFNSQKSNPVLKIAAWRPGRYILQNFAANIRDWSATDHLGNALHISKSSKNDWCIQAEAETRISFTYLYYCRQMDAGGCWSDSNLFYINTIACLMAVDGQENDRCTLKLNLPANFKIGTGMPQKDGLFQVDSFIALSDYPILASPTLITLSYEVQSIPFYIHSTVDASCFPNSIVDDFTKFTTAQIKDFNDFPESTYHFQLLILPYKHYHGVEHRNSTVICLGPETAVKETLYTELLGICSHELYHAWNICKIRPAEMVPYRLFESNYFKTGFVAEGITTYLGDYYLAQAKVFSHTWYQEEFNILLSRHFYSFGNKHLSVADSSYDLWVDGYDAGIPNRKVSIYVKGAIIAFLMDAGIRKSSAHTLTIRDFMARLWNRYKFNGEGYTEDSIAALFNEMTNNQFAHAYNRWVYETGDLKSDIIEACKALSIPIKEAVDPNFLAHKYGLLCNASYTVQSIDSNSPYIQYLSNGDKITAINNVPVAECSPDALAALDSLTIFCTNGIRTWEMVLTVSDVLYFKTLQIEINEASKLL